MKNLFSLFFLVFIFVISASAQDKKPSPAATASGKVGNTLITINYSQPSVKGRKIFGDLVPFGKVWRTGANDATTFEIDNDIKVEGKTLAKGKYALFTIPGAESWTIIFNKTTNQWGSFRYKQDEDVLRVEVKPGKSTPITEQMTFTIADGKVNLLWEYTVVSFMISKM
jgi:hypothetical protein